MLVILSNEPLREIGDVMEKVYEEYSYALPFPLTGSALRAHAGPQQLFLISNDLTKFGRLEDTPWSAPYLEDEKCVSGIKAVAEAGRSLDEEVAAFVYWVVTELAAGNILHTTIDTMQYDPSFGKRVHHWWRTVIAHWPEDQSVLGLAPEASLTLTPVEASISLSDFITHMRQHCTPHPVREFASKAAWQAWRAGRSNDVITSVAQLSEKDDVLAVVESTVSIEGSDDEREWVRRYAFGPNKLPEWFPVPLDYSHTEGAIVCVPEAKLFELLVHCDRGGRLAAGWDRKGWSSPVPADQEAPLEMGLGMSVRQDPDVILLPARDVLATENMPIKFLCEIYLTGHFPFVIVYDETTDLEALRSKLGDGFTCGAEKKLSVYWVEK